MSMCAHVYVRMRTRRYTSPSSQSPIHTDKHTQVPRHRTKYTSVYKQVDYAITVYMLGCSNNTCACLSMHASAYARMSVRADADARHMYLCVLICRPGYTDRRMQGHSYTHASVQVYTNEERHTCINLCLHAYKWIVYMEAQTHV